MPTTSFHPLVQEWFASRFAGPTEPQLRGWPSIAAGRHTLIAAPTGSGKTLTAFLVCVDQLLRQAIQGDLPEGTQVVYVSPLKALSNDIERNLQVPLAEIRELARRRGLPDLPLRVAVRTGDTLASERQAMLRTPPHILVTTPESLYILLTSAKGREPLRSVRTVIVDEIHALARDKRGSHLALTLERLAALTGRPLQRIGLSATQKPIEEIAWFLVGGAGSPAAAAVESPPALPPHCTVVDIGHVRELDLALDVPPSELATVCSHEQWAEVYARLVELIESHRSTLVFVNTRRLAERVAHALTELLGEDAVASHHGSLSREIRLDAEQRLKAGGLRAIVATASLEMGIDVGYIDLVCQIGSPRSIATFLQRIGRSGHALGLVPKGRLFPLTRDELLECLALLRAVRQRELDRIEIPVAPLDILAQQIVAAAAADEWDESELFQLCRRAWPYRDLSPADFQTLLRMLADGLKPGSKAGAYLHRDQIHSRVKARRGARLAAVTSGGAIPEKAEYRVVTEQEGTFVGTLDEDFAIESMAGDVFLLGNASWRITHVRGGEVVVNDAHGAPPTVPFWFGEAPGRTVELSRGLSEVRHELARRVGPVETPRLAADPAAPRDPLVWLEQECGTTGWPAEQAVRYVAAQHAAMGRVPTADAIVFERFFDESGGMQLVIHAPLGSRINRAWGLALRKRFCRSFDFELQAAADDNGVLLSLGPQHSFPIESLFSMLGPHNGQHLLEQALLAVPMFQVRWRWNVTRALAVLRQQGGKKVPPFLQKFRSEDLLAAAFPETVGCLENHHGDVQIPDHPLVRQTMHDCLHEAMDLRRWIDVLANVKEGQIELVPFEAREPSPFSHQLINANPYAFLDGAPLEERRTRAVSTRRSLAVEEMRDLAQLDGAAIAQVAAEAWPLVRDADELHDALCALVVLREDEGAEWTGWFRQLARDGRATVVETQGAAPGEIPLRLWAAAERWPLVQALYPAARAQPPVALPAELQTEWQPADARVELIRGRMPHCGPVAAAALAERFQLPASAVEAALEAVEGQGLVLRGRFTPGAGEVEWCDRRLLARIHRLTLEGLRRRIQPVAPEQFIAFLLQHQGFTGARRTGAAGLRETLAQLQGLEIPAGAWERHILAPRLEEYDPQELDHLFLAGELVWGRLQPPRREEKEGAGMAAMTRAAPIALPLRGDLPWLLPAERPDVAAFAGSQALEALTALQVRGALFFQELLTLCGLLPAHLEQALRELAALGLVTSDTFAAVRTISAGAAATNRRLRPGRPRPAAGRAPVGRWSLFPGLTAPVEKAERVERWCRQLLARYGVLFRDLLARESAAPPWFELVRVLRRLELRGEIRGGRFVSGVGGEQFATEQAVAQLRALRDQPASPDDWAVVSAVDPVNLTGVVTAGPRIAASHKTSLILRGGRCIAVKQAGRIEFLEAVDAADELAMRRALQLGRRLRTPDDRSRRPPLAV